MQKKKIKYLIFISISGLLALSLVQAYLINNTYKLEKSAFISETRKSISKIDNLSTNLDSINNIWQESFLNMVSDYQIGLISNKLVLQKFDSITESINGEYIKTYQKELKSRKLDQNLKFQKIIKTIIVLDTIKNDTIFTTKNNTPIHLLGDKFSIKNSHKVSTSVWLAEHTLEKVIEGKLKEIAFNLQFETEDRMNIDGWKRIVIRRMTLLLLISIFIFLLVFGLLYYSIKSLITQKKIADIKTDFVNNITHELKTPLATLTLATKMLKKEKAVKASALADNFVNTIERQNKRLQNLIDQVLNNSLGYKEIVLHKEAVNIKNYLNNVLDDFQLSVKQNNVTIKSVLEVGSEKITIDKFFLTTALHNILENAVKYSKDTVQIEFLATLKAYLEITIQDNGIGISAQNQKLLFDKFFRAGDKKIHDVKGLGLGLYYTNQIIKVHGGEISVKSTEGKGTTFKIKIPK